MVTYGPHVTAIFPPKFLKTSCSYIFQPDLGMGMGEGRDRGEAALGLNLDQFYKKKTN